MNQPLRFENRILPQSRRICVFATAVASSVRPSLSRNAKAHPGLACHGRVLPPLRRASRDLVERHQRPSERVLDHHQPRWNRQRFQDPVV